MSRTVRYVDAAFTLRGMVQRPAVRVAKAAKHKDRRRNARPVAVAPRRLHLTKYFSSAPAFAGPNKLPTQPALDLLASRRANTDLLHSHALLIISRGLGPTSRSSQSVNSAESCSSPMLGR